jgi:hypothetical protein
MPVGPLLAGCRVQRKQAVSFGGFSYQVTKNIIFPLFLVAFLGIYYYYLLFSIPPTGVLQYLFLILWDQKTGPYDL